MTTDFALNGMDRNILVTGGAGYVGSHACKALAAAGYLPIVFDDLRLGNRWAVRWGPLVKGALEDREAIVAAIREYNISTVMHFAAYSNVGESMTDPSRYFRNNVSLSLNVFDAMVETGVDRLVVSSTSAVHGIPSQIPMREDAPSAPINTYGASKMMLEEIARWYGFAHGLRTVALRYFNAAGADPDAGIGELHDPETHLVPIAVQAALGHRPFLQINGTDYDTADGTAVRDYIHVRDIAEAHVAALNALNNGGESGAFNLGTGRGLSVREIVDAVNEAAGRHIRIVEGPRRQGDPPVLVADPGQAKCRLGWEARMSDVSQIAETAVRWHRDVLPNIVLRNDWR